MTAVMPLYSQAVTDEAAKRDLILVTGQDDILGTVVTIYPAERPDVVFGSAWQLEPGGPWRAGRTFDGSCLGELYDDADAAITAAMDGPPLTKRLAYILTQKNSRR